MWMVVDLIALLIVVAYAAIGFFRGFSEFLFQVISILITIGVVFFAYKPVANVVMDTQLDEKIYSVVYENLANTPIAEGEEISTENTNMSKGIVSLSIRPLPQ